VPVDVIEPKGGVSARNKGRVLIDLHGGGFTGGWDTNSLFESLPMAGLGQIKVVTVNYREMPEAQFPAGSEDVAHVYRALLKEYKPADIGIYGCSAGGLLTAESLAWFQTHGLPRPGAAGIFCEGGLVESVTDSRLIATALGGSKVPPSPPSGADYFGNADKKNQLISPALWPEVLRKFPPTLIITGTRDPALSEAVFTHAQLIKAGIDAELHVWEGQSHAAFYDTAVPESREAWNVMVSFFDKHLAHD
jgi:acetyl esterase/lipase